MRKPEPTPSTAGARRWLATLAGSLGVGLAIALGCWQLDRAAQKQALQTAITEQAASAPLDAAGVRALHSQPAQAWRHRRAELRGRWLADRSIYLDNRQMQGRPGFFVLTPLELEQGGVVLVQRGWLARNFQDRLALLPFQTPGGSVAVEGRLAERAGRIYALAAGDSPDPNHPAIRQNLDLPGYADETGLRLWPLVLVQTDAANDGLLRDWPSPDQGISKHHGYAFQWFALAGGLALLLLWFQFLRPRRALSTDHDLKQN